MQGNPDKFHCMGSRKKASDLFLSVGGISKGTKGAEISVIKRQQIYVIKYKNMFNGIKICNKTQKYEINVNIGSKTV